MSPFFLVILQPQLRFIYRLWFFVFYSLPTYSFACTIVIPLSRPSSFSHVLYVRNGEYVILVLQMHSARELPSVQVCENLMNSLRTT